MYYMLNLFYKFFNSLIKCFNNVFKFLKKIGKGSFNVSYCFTLLQYILINLFCLLTIMFTYYTIIYNNNKKF